MRLLQTGSDMSEFIDLKSLSLDSLVGAVSLYPWFGAARKELCDRMSAMGGDSWGEEQYADAAMYIPSRRKIADCMKATETSSYADADVDRLLRAYISDETSAREEQGAAKPRKVRVVGGDYFTQDQYDMVKGPEIRFGSFGKRDVEREGADAGYLQDNDFCTETLAQIYAEQGYYEQAKDIYSKLILAYPEKNAYFAALIEKIEREIKK